MRSSGKGVWVVVEWTMGSGAEGFSFYMCNVGTVVLVTLLNFTLLLLGKRFISVFVIFSKGQFKTFDVIYSISVNRYKSYFIVD